MPPDPTPNPPRPVRQLRQLRRPAGTPAPSSTVQAGAYSDADPKPGAALCDTCAAAAATHTLSYPDGRMRICRRCLPVTLFAVAEPLDIDDELAWDARCFIDRRELR